MRFCPASVSPRRPPRLGQEPPYADAPNRRSFAACPTAGRPSRTASSLYQKQRDIPQILRESVEADARSRRIVSSHLQRLRRLAPSPTIPGGLRASRQPFRGATGQKHHGSNPGKDRRRDRRVAEVTAEQRDKGHEPKNRGHHDGAPGEMIGVARQWPVGRRDHRSRTSRCGSSRLSLTRTRKVTASRPSTILWS